MIQLMGHLTNGRFSIQPTPAIVYSYPAESLHLDLQTRKRIQIECSKIQHATVCLTADRVKTEAITHQKVSVECNKQKTITVEVTVSTDA